MARIMPDDRRPIANGAQTQAAAPTDTDLRRKLTTTMVLVLFALVAIAMATFAWFSIADSAKTRMLMIDANADGSLRFDLDEPLAAGANAALYLPPEAVVCLG